MESLDSQVVFLVQNQLQLFFFFFFFFFHIFSSVRIYGRDNLPAAAAASWPCACQPPRVSRSPLAHTYRRTPIIFCVAAHMSILDLTSSYITTCK
jgi:hypothetical protein